MPPDLIRFLASVRLTVVLIAVLAVISIPGTFASRAGLTLPPLYIGLVALLLLNIGVCSVRRWKSMRRSSLVIHAGLAGLAITGMLAAQRHVMTVNVYEGTAVSRAFDWKLDREVDLGHEVEVREIRTAYYPAGVRVGILKDGQKAALHEAHTGETFGEGEMTLTVTRLDPLRRTAVLSVERTGGLSEELTIGQGDTPLEADPGYTFRLVAFETPTLREASIELAIIQDGRTVAEGTSRVNAPFEWNHRTYHHVTQDHDNFGSVFAGLQIVEDPWRPAVYGAMAVLAAGVAWRMAELLAGRGKRQAAAGRAMKAEEAEEA